MKAFFIQFTRKLAGLMAFILLASCSSGSCRENRDAAEKMNPQHQSGVAVSGPINPIDRVRVYKYDGSKQCGMADGFSLEEMKKELKEISVLSAKKKADGLMHIQMCGAATGMANVYEIDKKDIGAAVKQGFKEWIWE